VRREFWAYDVDEKLDAKQLHQIKYNVGASFVIRLLLCSILLYLTLTMTDDRHMSLSHIILPHV